MTVEVWMVTFTLTITRTTIVAVMTLITEAASVMNDMAAYGLEDWRAAFCCPSGDAKTENVSQLLDHIMQNLERRT
ncbi:unnamed protein product [Gongylonema pulchrum]|uniref:Secreted protein n=1 Tax=Gongylonema pulchrum TaxID=637853 RepID=A0A183DZB3_9BILA|nr:unnamed protein product [Gongylonema pulchrum]